MRISFLLFLLVSLDSFGQFSDEYHTYNDKYPDESIIRLQKITTINIKIVDGKIDIKQEIYEEDIYMNEMASYGSKRSVSSSSFFELEKIEASSFLYENGKYRESKVEDFKGKDELDESFYDDIKTHNFIYPKLNKGSKTNLKYTENIKDPRFLSPFYFGNFMPIVNNKVVIIADKEISMRFQEFNTKGSSIKFSKEEKRGKVMYTWEQNDIKKYEYEENVPTYKNVLPHIIPIINYYKVDGEDVKVLENISDLYNWYYSLVKDLNKDEIDENLIKLVDELTSDKETDLEKVKAIYYWTQNNIKYIDYEYSLGGFIPRDANVVFKKKYGDCKDNSSILKQMLDIAGLEGNLTWVGTRTIPYTYEDVPTPIVDNHMILSYTYNDKLYLLDATGRYMPIEFPSSFIQGKEALVSLGENEFKIVKIPIVPADKNTFIDQTNIHLEGEKVVGTSQAVVSGYKKINYFNYLEYETSSDKIEEFYNARLQKGNNKFLIENFEESNKFEYDKDLLIKYDFKIGNYFKEIGDEIYINLNLNRTLSIFKTKDDRENEIEYSYKQKYNYNTVFEIPTGFTVDYLPENTSISNNFITSETTYVLTKNKILYSHLIILDFINLNTEQQKEVNNLIDKVDKSYKEVIVLKKTN